MLNSIKKYITRKNQYCFKNVWTFDASVEEIWEELVNYRKWPEWCSGLESIESSGFTNHVERGRCIRSTWKGSLPYRLSFDSVISTYLRNSEVSFYVNGDLEGLGQCRLFHEQQKTIVHLVWKVSPTRFWIKMSAPFARHIFINNHNRIISGTADGFTRRINNKIRMRPALVYSSGRCDNAVSAKTSTSGRQKFN